MSFSYIEFSGSEFRVKWHGAKERRQMTDDLASVL
jgi:hypothetical protein